MDGVSQTLTIADIVEINRCIINEFGGLFISDNDNLVNPGSLLHVLEEIQGSLFGFNLYPSLFEKAAVLGWRIIKFHVFLDGNKRTGMEACRNFLEINGFDMRIDSSVVDVALGIAKGDVALAEFTNWVIERSTKIEQ